MISTRQELEAMLTRVKGFHNPKPVFEQYLTPPRVAATLLWIAYTSGDIYDKNVIDLGCGTGMLSVGAGLLGAKQVTGVEIDEEAILVARENVESFSLQNIKLVSGDMLELDVNEFRSDSVIMNPPFGVQNPKKDRVYLDMAFKLAPVVYSLINYHPDNVSFLQRHANNKGFTGRLEGVMDYEIPRTYYFHKKQRKLIKVALISFREQT